jgi:hypothetical protein
VGSKGALAVVVALVLSGVGLLPSEASARPSDRSGPLIEPKYGKFQERTPICQSVPGHRMVCVHWVNRGPQRSTRHEATATASILRHVWRTEVTKLGYLAPLKDKKGRVRGAPRSAFDVYLTRIGSSGQIAGYCRHEGAIHTRRGVDARPSYCVLDDDFAEFANGNCETQPDTSRATKECISAGDVRKATAAHEFFHAIQDGYDAIGEPGWLTEGTAVWIEGQVYPHIHSRDRYLDASPLTDPDTPLDAADRYPHRASDSSFRYGAWVFWQFLSESRSPAIVRSVWDRARKGRRGDRVGLTRVLNDLLGSFDDTFAEFGIWNFAIWNYGIEPGFYREGARYLRVIRKRPPLDASYILDSTRTSTATLGQRRTSLHVAPLATGYVGISHDNSGGNCAIRISTRLPPHTDSSLLVQRRVGFTELGHASNVSLGPDESAVLILSNAGDRNAAAIGYHAETSAADCP